MDSRAQTEQSNPSPAENTLGDKRAVQTSICFHKKFIGTLCQWGVTQYCDRNIQTKTIKPESKSQVPTKFSFQVKTWTCLRLSPSKYLWSEVGWAVPSSKKIIGWTDGPHPYPPSTVSSELLSHGLHVLNDWMIYF